jgi:tetratricopeptide (TPR) repeat protein
LTVAIAALALAFASLVPNAQAQDTSLLDRAERLADQGDARAARQALSQWEAEASSDASLDERARAWFLAGRLADDGSEAELYYLRVVFDGSSSRYADDALLRLGQYKYAQAEYAKAIDYLGRLRRDYPTSELAAEALLWVSKAAGALGDSERACAAAEQGLRELPPTDSLLGRSLRDERSRCGELVRRYSVQVAAFQDVAAAQGLARSLLNEGFDAWVLNATERDPLYRVRVGRGLIEAEAQALADRLVQAGHSPFLVSQAVPPPDER